MGKVSFVTVLCRRFGGFTVSLSQRVHYWRYNYNYTIILLYHNCQVEEKKKSMDSANQAHTDYVLDVSQ